MPPWVPKRGDAIYIDFSPQSGREQSGHRPALVLSPRAYNDKVGLAIVCPITNQAKGYPFEVDIPSGSVVGGVILADHVKSLDWRGRKASFKCTLPDEVLESVFSKLDTLFDLNTPS